MNMKAENTRKALLLVDESDPSGAEGIQGDIKTIQALGEYAFTAITSMALPRDKKFVPGSTTIEPRIIGRQMRSFLPSVDIDAIKIGYIESEDAINVIADVLDEYCDKNVPVIIDPSIVSRGGQVLVDDDAIAAWKRRLYIHAKILTPNAKEAELLGGMPIADIDDMRHSADMMRTLGIENVILKAGQVEGGKELYFVATPTDERIYERPTVDTPHTLGAGNAFSSALAVNMAKGLEIFDAIEHALDFVHQAILHGCSVGKGAGSINHSFHIDGHNSVFYPEAIKVYSA